MDTCAGGRYQATYNAAGSRASHWIPLWICYAAGAVPTGRALDCNVEGLGREAFLRTVPEYDIYVFYGNQETAAYDQKTTLLLAQARKSALVVFAGTYATVVPDKVLSAPGLDAVIRGEVLASNAHRSQVPQTQHRECRR
jgi:hypothetical protein